MKNTRFILIFGSLLALVALCIYLVLDFSYGSNTDNSYSLENSNSTCIECHGVMDGLSPLHAQLECVSCHKGNNTLQDKDSSHFGMVRVPGNLADARETCGLCHADAIEHITSSLMTTNSGIIAVDKYVFGEEETPNTIQHVANTEHSMADEHLRALCLRCHLGSEKNIYGPITQQSRGGGCNACHLNYSSKSEDQLAVYLEEGSLPTVHPSLDLNITDDHCFGCHSRSGRLSTNYEGFHETLLTSPEVGNQASFRELEDGRIFKEVNSDIHHDRGLACIDCHGYDDVMGDGNTYIHEEDAVKISCDDCHTSSPKTQKLADLNFTQQRIIKIRDYEHTDQPILITAKDSAAISNGFVNQQGELKLVSKLSGEIYDLIAPTSSCAREFGHNSLTCTSCHTQWAPQCLGCHVTYEAESKGYDLLDKKEMDGTWVEYAGSFLYGPPTLGVRTNESKSIEPAIPGMIMTLDKSSFKPHALPEDTSFYRLFAPASPHTIGATGRNCTSCHNNPLALGYGRGVLKLEEQNGDWNWTFKSEYEVLADGLPADAWIGFMKDPQGVVSTRTNFRPFTVDEQKTILRVGACLTCHDNASAVMQKSLHADFEEYLNSVSKECVVIW